MLLVQHLKAPNDTNGNPRRLYVVYRAKYTEGRYATVIGVYDEGYKGNRAVPDEIRTHTIELPEMNITPGEYRAWLKTEVTE